MRRALRRAAQTLLAAGALGLVRPGVAQVPASAPTRPAPAAEARPGRLEELKVELAWLADPVTFPSPLKARVVGEALEVRGYAPDETARNQALRVARDHATTPVRDVIEIRAAAIPHTTVTADAVRQGAVEVLAQTFGETARGFEVSAEDNGQVVLNGSVNSVEEMALASRKMRLVRGCTQVMNHLQVSPVMRDGRMMTQVTADGTVAVAGHLTCLDGAGQEAYFPLEAPITPARAAVKPVAAPVETKPAVAPPTRVSAKAPTSWVDDGTQVSTPVIRKTVEKPAPAPTQPKPKPETVVAVQYIAPVPATPAPLTRDAVENLALPPVESEYDMRQKKPNPAPTWVAVSKPAPAVPAPTRVVKSEPDKPKRMTENDLMALPAKPITEVDQQRSVLLGPPTPAPVEIVQMPPTPSAPVMSARPEVAKSPVLKASVVAAKEVPTVDQPEPRPADRPRVRPVAVNQYASPTTVSPKPPPGGWPAALSTGPGREPPAALPAAAVAPAKPTYAPSPAVKATDQPAEASKDKRWPDAHAVTKPREVVQTSTFASLAEPPPAAAAPEPKAMAHPVATATPAPVAAPSKGPIIINGSGTPTIDPAKLQKKVREVCGVQATDVQVVRQADKSVHVQIKVGSPAAAKLLTDKVLQLPEMSSTQVYLDMFVGP